MPDPDFLVIGAQKCGTTWLSSVMDTHPDIFGAPAKELHFFSKSGVYNKGMVWYRKQFQGYNGEKTIGEFSTSYFLISSDEREIKELDLNPNIPELVYKHYPNIKLIVSLRDPVKRAISSYYHHIARRRFAPTCSILDVGHKYGIISIGLYYHHLREWLKFFQRDQFLILIYEDDIVSNREKALRNVFRFLEVNEDFNPPNINMKYNVRPSYLYLYLNYYFPRLVWRMVKLVPAVRQINFPKIQVKPDEIEELSRLYLETNQLLEDYLGRVLPWSHQSLA